MAITDSTENSMADSNGGVAEHAFWERRLEDSLASLEEHLDRLFEELESRREAILSQELELRRRENSVVARESQTRLQRRRIAEDFRERRNARPSTSEASANTSSQLETLEKELPCQEQLAEQAIAKAVQLRENSANQADLASLEKENASLLEGIDELREALRIAERKLEGIETADGEAAEEDAASIGSGFDWETQKKMLLQSLGDEHADVAPQLAAVDRARTVVQTGYAVDAQEVERLREQIQQLLAALATIFNERSEDAGAGFDFAAALEAEREKLRMLQEEWHEKLRESELEISVERAKLARERAKLEEDLRAFREKAATSEGAAVVEDAPKSRWLARLGLADEK